MKLERVKAIYDQLSKYEIDLEQDPRSLGPLYLQNTIATCRNYLNLVSRFQLEVHREKQELDRSRRAAEVEYEVALAELLANDERVRRAPSIQDRQATANMILREQLNTIAGFKAQLQDLEYVEKAVRHRHRELTSTMTEIKLQRSLIRDEIDSGAMYGDERKSDHERGPSTPLGDEIDETELDKLLNSETEAATAEAPAVVETPPPKAPEPEPAPEVKPEPDEAAVKAFLEESGPAPATESEDFAEVFARL
jgi:hypothetical protein